MAEKYTAFGNTFDRMQTDSNGKAAAPEQVRCINQVKRGMLALNIEWLGMGQLSHANYNHSRMNQLDLCGTSGLAPFYLALQRALDLPFAQKRWCAAAGIDKVRTLSDYQDRSFASAYGVLIKELKLLSRSVFVVDGCDTVRYVQHVKEVTQEPDYAAVLSAAKNLR